MNKISRPKIWGERISKSLKGKKLSLEHKNKLGL